MGCVRLTRCLLWIAAFAIPRATDAAIVTLSAARQTNQIVLSWPENGQRYSLEVTDELAPGAKWWAARLASRVDGGSNSVVINPSRSARFYQLTTNHGVAWFQTTGGPFVADGGALVLPHEHIFTDLRGPNVAGYGQADIEDVVRVMKPLLVEAKAGGVDLLVECSSIGVGRNVPIIHRLVEESQLPVIVPTGVYGRANFAPTQHRAMTEDQLTDLFIREIREGIEGSSIKAGFIKIASSEATLTALEEKFLRAAGRAARDTGAALASHTTAGTVARRQADILESISPSVRFIWVHAQAERAGRWHWELAALGAFIEFDSLGWQPSEDNNLITAIKDLVAAGHGDRILLSHDAGWYQPGQANGGTQKPYTYLQKTFIPKLRSSGIDEATITMITRENPLRAFALITPTAGSIPPN